MTARFNTLSDPLGTGQASATVLSGREAVMRSGQHLCTLVEVLRGLEPAFLASDPVGKPGTGERRSKERLRLQSLDRVIQELVGLSDILIGAAPYLSDLPVAEIDALIERPRLQSLANALRDQGKSEAPPQVEIF